MVGSFIVVASAILFGCLTSAQLLSKKTITLKGAISKDENPKKFWTLTMFYSAAFLSALNFIID